jgi:hypothetical protein
MTYDHLPTDRLGYKLYHANSLVETLAAQHGRGAPVITPFMSDEEAFTDIDTVVGCSCMMAQHHDGTTPLAAQSSGPHIPHIPNPVPRHTEVVNGRYILLTCMMCMYLRLCLCAGED